MHTGFKQQRYFQNNNRIRIVFFDLLELTIGFLSHARVHNCVEQLLFAGVIKNKIAQRLAVDISVGQQNAFAKGTNNLPVRRRILFDHLARNPVGVNDDGAGGFKDCGYR